MARRNNPSLIESFAALRADYSAAKQSRFRRRRTGLAPMGSGADYHYRSEADYLRIMEYARDMDRNDCIVGQVIDRAVANQVQDGFLLTPATNDPELNKDLAARWQAEASDADLCDVNGELTFWDQEQAVARACMVDGDILDLCLSDGTSELVEGHRLRTPTFSKNANIIHGVEMKTCRQVVDGKERTISTRRPLRYWLTADDVGTGQVSLKINEFRQCPARDDAGVRQVFHARSVKRVSQTRGISALAPIFDVCGMFEDINFATLLQRQIVSAFVIFEERDKDYQQLIAEGFAGGNTEEHADGKPRNIEGLGPAMIYPGKAGVKYHLDSPNIPNPEFFPHMKLILTLIGINLGLPLCLTLMDAGETNFSGFRGAVDQARMGFRQTQRKRKEQWHTPKYLWKLRRWMAKDRALAKRVDRSDVNVFGHRWNLPTWPYIQPMQDASADLIRTRNALISQRRRCAERNMEWGDLSTEITEDNADLIHKAWMKAEELNKKCPGLNVTWREIASLPMAEGMQISLNTAQQSEQNNAAA